MLCSGVGLQRRPIMVVSVALANKCCTHHLGLARQGAAFSRPGGNVEILIEGTLHPRPGANLDEP